MITAITVLHQTLLVCGHLIGSEDPQTFSRAVTARSNEQEGQEGRGCIGRPSIEEAQSTTVSRIREYIHPAK